MKLDIEQIAVVGQGDGFGWMCSIEEGVAKLRVRVDGRLVEVEMNVDEMRQLCEIGIFSFVAAQNAAQLQALEQERGKSAS